MEAKAERKYIRLSPQKLGPLAKALRCLSPLQAKNRLAFLGKKGARELASVIGEALNNAKSLGLAVENLKFKEIQVNEGPRLKRADKSHGARFDPGTIHKRMSHLRIILEEIKPKNGPKS
jgi:large subunit ribosomal protein L22